jgi:hypothetical protein
MDWQRGKWVKRGSLRVCCWGLKTLENKWKVIWVSFMLNYY